MELPAQAGARSPWPRSGRAAGTRPASSAVLGALHDPVWRRRLL